MKRLRVSVRLAQSLYGTCSPVTGLSWPAAGISILVKMKTGISNVKVVRTNWQSWSVGHSDA
jgi:hypothetical protein